ncbi:S-layer homology domain-containing protein [Paenibacillus fonticola]|uniref:S-layer homology domain-containing protein n=1 Tax=Paenibacillus fonticola TaxID=379896 RepID=UPI00035F1598|nr:S-layer homology domain-containing protein [Paenibacillus fonticola]
MKQLRRKSNKFLSLILGLSLLVSPVVGTLTAPGQANAESNAKRSSIQQHWAGVVLQDWQNKGYIKGDEQGNLQPDAKVTRAELAALINRSFQVEESKEVSYSDVKAEAWYYKDVAKATAKGYMKGYENGTFKPSANVSRQELAVVLTSLLGLKPSDASNAFKDTANSPAWSKGAIGAVADSGLMKGNDGKFNPLAPATRAEVVSVLDRALKQLSDQATVTYDQAGVYGPSSGTETIKGSVHITTADVTLNNLVIEGDLQLGEGIGEGDVTLNNVTVKGTTVVEGGGKNSIHVVDSVLLTVIVNKKDGSVRIVAEGNSVVSQVTLQSGAILEEAGLSGLGFQDLILSEQIPAGAEVSLAGKFETVDVVATSLNINLLSGSIGELAISNQAADNNIQISASALISSLILNAAANVGGQGSIGHAEINASGSTLAQRPGSVSYNNNSSANINDQPSTGGSSTGSAGGSSSSGSDSGNNGGSTQPQQNHLVATNGKVSLKFVNVVSGLELTDLDVSATIEGDVVSLENIAFDSSSNELSFDPVSLDEHYGKQLLVQIAPKAGVTKFSGTLSGSVRLEGFAGTIVDVDDQPVAGMTIQFRRGLSNTAGAVAATVVTDQNGRYSVSLPAGIYTGELNKAGFITGYVVAVSASELFNTNEDATAIKVPESGELRIVLTWGEKPRDEDSHLIGPTPAGGNFHTWYADKVHYFNDEVYADLDHDDVDSYGPETTTIRKRVDGLYTFYVHNYSRNGYDGTETLRKSSAKVEVYDASGTALSTYHIPVGAGGELYWHVFDMKVEGNDIQFINQNLLTNVAPTGATSEPSPEFAVLLEEKDKIASVTTVTYEAQLGSALSLTKPGESLLEETRVKIRNLTPRSVTDVVYLEESLDQSEIIFNQYNNSGDTIYYDVEIELSRGSFTVTQRTTIELPTFDVFLYEVKSAAEALARPELADEIQAAQDAIGAGIDLGVKLAALQSLLHALANL